MELMSRWFCRAVYGQRTLLQAVSVTSAPSCLVVFVHGIWKCVEQCKGNTFLKAPDTALAHCHAHHIHLSCHSLVYPTTLSALPTPLSVTLAITLAAASALDFVVACQLCLTHLDSLSDIVLRPFMYVIVCFNIVSP